MVKNEKIYGWMNTQLSIARFYGGCTVNGIEYSIDESDPERPLVQKQNKEKKVKLEIKIMKDLFGAVDG